ncbi:MAG: LPS assembly protein LptD, partial [Mariprofundaceae bacterium]|nr:LPS assembly protein LptD [Mariprofundaceae bacterium]
MLLLLPLCATAADIGIVADKIVRDANGVATASGTVEIERAGETLQADKVRYDAASKQILAEGNVHIVTVQADIHASSGDMNSENKAGELLNAELLMPGGESLRAERLLRLDEFTYQAFNPVMTTCPKDSETWHLYASEGTLDQKEGVFKAKHARFEFAGVPLFYTPYWQQAIRRKSGFMMPLFAFGKRRGTEWALPYYFAPAPDWDATLTPHWMTARGMMSEAEVRHASTFGHETLRFEGLHDKLTSTSRGRLKGDANWRLPLDMSLALKGDEVNDPDYLADFSRNSKELALRYLTSSATLSQGFEYGSWSLASIYNHDLSTVNNKATLQQYPNFNLNLGVPLLDSPATLYVAHNTTRFSNSTGAAARRDWRTYLHPYITLPWTMLNGGISSTVTLGSTYTKYWLNQRAARRPSMRSGEFSLD